MFVLAPLYVWGAWRAGGWAPEAILGFVLVHLALYPGANAFNSAHDRDEGPIGGLARPPSVPRGLAAGATGLQAAGAALAPLVGWGFALAYLALWGVFTAYSHPATRWKRSPAISTAAIALGQGGLGVTLGWLAAGGDPAALLAPRGIAVAVVGIAAAGGLYPWTQAYQVDADRARGERTLAAVLGPHGTYVWGGAGFALVALATAALGLDLFAVYAFAVAIVALLGARRARRGRSPSYGIVMGVVYANSAVLLLLLAASAR